MNHNKQRAVGRLVDDGAQLVDELLLRERLCRRQPDLLVLKPVRRVDNHAQPQRRPDAGVESADRQRLTTV